MELSFRVYEGQRLPRKGLTSEAALQQGELWARSDRVDGLAPAVRDVMTISGFDNILPLAADRTAALQLLK